MKNYLQFKEERQEAFDNFEGIFFAFDEKRFNEKLKEVGAESGKDVFSLGFGGYMLKSRADDFKNMQKKFDDELLKLLNNDEFLRDALLYELANHEYSYTGDAKPAFDALGLKFDKKLLQEVLSK